MAARAISWNKEDPLPWETRTSTSRTKVSPSRIEFQGRPWTRMRTPTAVLVNRPNQIGSRDCSKKLRSIALMVCIMKVNTIEIEPRENQTMRGRFHRTKMHRNNLKIQGSHPIVWQVSKTWIPTIILVVQMASGSVVTRPTSTKQRISEARKYHHHATFHIKIKET